ncbi:unnamed protein product [Calicophoron daubneyi]|uniref:Aquaporin n=1 Tax=Calicophoron daubneyi TaxID=300641 RepID=A0AAV2TGX6_CALDB
MSEYPLTRYELRPPMNEVPRCNAYIARFMVRLFFCEMFGVAMLSFPLTVYTGLKEFTESLSTMVSLAYGVAAWTFGHLSGAQIHTGVTLTLLFTRRITYPYAIVSIVAQLVGAIFGSGMAIVITDKYPNSTTHYGLAKLPEGSSAWQAFLMETIAVIIILLMALSALDESRRGPFACGCTIAYPFMFAMSVVFTAPMIAEHSGIGLNPAMMLGAAIVNNYYKDVWIYIVAPIVGCLIAAIIYDMLLSNAASTARIRHWFTDPNFDRHVNYKVLDGEVQDNKID